ncbi:MAG: hypothetical protein JWR37_4981 [Mycobacterium sp.]|nr:hypothetical protein [Mycobacterium sp.]
MPEMTFTVRWPDGVTEQCYSPSLVIHDYLQDSATYPIDEFMSLTIIALTQASERVKARFGTYCTSAAAQIEELQAARRRYGNGETAGDVTVLRMTPGASA